MANNSTRTVNLVLNTQTTGNENVKNLSEQLRNLAKNGGDAAPEFERLAVALEQSANAEANQARQMKAANADLAKTKQALLDARAAVSAYQASIGGARNATAEQAAELARLNRAVLDNRAANDSAKASTAAASAELNRLKAATQSAVTEAQKLTSELSATNEAGKVSTGVFGGLSGVFNTMKGALSAIGISAVGQKFLDANLAADKLQKSLNAVNGDAVKTASDLAFLQETSQRLGINLTAASNGFVKLSAASKGTRLEGQATRDIFASVGGAMAQLGLSAEESERAFVAIGQMMSKGTIAAEELKGQLGDVLPGALNLAARATGLTTQELGKLMETGGLLAEDFLPRFAVEVQKSFGGASGDIQGLSNTIERAKNGWSQALAIFGNTGVMASLAASLGIVNEVLMILATGTTAIVAGFMAFVKAIGALAGALITLDFSQLKSSLTDIGKEMVDNVTKMARLTGTSRLLDEAMGDSAVATQAAATAASNSGAGWSKLVSAYDQAAKSASDYVDQLKKVAKATADQSEVAVKLAQLSGNENALLLAKEEATRQAASSSEKLAAALDNETKALQAKVIALQEEIEGQKDVSIEKLKAIEEAKKLAEAKGEEARAALSSAEASRIAVSAAEAESAARMDNSQRVNELKFAYEQAAMKVDVLRAAQLSGIDVSAEITVAQTAAAKAAFLYNDALSDQVAKIKENAAAKAGQLSIEQAGVKLAIEQQRTILEVARARGDEYGAIMALTEIKRLEIELAELVAKAKAAEAEAALLVVKAKREELTASGELTAAKEAELKAQEAGAQVKVVEAQIAGEVAARMKELAETYLMVGDAADGTAEKIRKIGDAARDSVDGVESLANSLDGMNKAGGMRAGGTGVFDLNTELKKMGVSDEQAKTADKTVFEKAMTEGLAGMSPTDNPRLWSFAAGQIAADAAQQALIAGQTKNTTAATTTTAPSTPRLDLLSNVQQTTTEPQAAPTPVNITISGRTSLVNVATQADASNLAGIFRLLETDAARRF